MQVTAGVGKAAADISFEEVNDGAFLARLRADGAEGRLAFTLLVRVTHGRLLAYIRRHLGSLEESQEALQEVFLAAHKGLARFEGKARLTTWMYSLAHHKVCDCIAERTRARTLFQEAGDDPEAHGMDASARADEDWSRVSPWGSAPDKVLARNTAGGLIAAAVATLVPPGSDVYHLRDVEGLSGEEVAEMLGLSHAAVRVQLHRARADIVAWVRARMAGSAGSAGPAAPLGKRGQA
jgi:RNA polymerase sigma-70 factor (ECF subfamily)